ncbi:MAG: hypothetical protein K2P76_01660 [Lachnospiraceae bacterium]|nr:hypothetical protein [Lachnospiraceae bacterium]
MPKPELYVISTDNKVRKPDINILIARVFYGADIDIEIKAKVIYESDKDNIINDMPYLFVKSWLPKTKINRTGTRSADNSANHGLTF